jgi:hypothetical protein
MHSIFSVDYAMFVWLASLELKCTTEISRICGLSGGWIGFCLRGQLEIHVLGTAYPSHVRPLCVHLESAFSYWSLSAVKLLA